MKKRTSTDMAIEALVAATCGDNPRERHIYREALRGLVRFARSEQLLEMRADMARLGVAHAARAARRQAKAVLHAHRLNANGESKQRQLEFNQR